MKNMIAILMVGMALRAGADDFKTTDGHDYKGVTVSRAEPDGLVVVTDAGIEKILFVNLPADVQKKYSFDPGKAAQYSQAQAQARYDREQKQKTQDQTKAAYIGVKDYLEKNAVKLFGNIIQITKKGCIVDQYGKQPIFIYGAGEGMADGDQFVGLVYPAGLFKYTTTAGAEVTVHAYAVDVPTAMAYMVAQQP